MNLSNHIDVWNGCLAIIRDIVSKPNYDTWFRPVRSVSLEDSILTLAVPSHFFREYLEEHFIDVLQLALRREIGPQARLVYQVRIVEGSEVRLPEQNSKPYSNNEVP
ncbi:MAG: chromosomal replication initiator protein DnaA, partial [Bacteroidales bacterium]|nr:chromosomal replication initiator protein DnaA [Bacteroidales bacterium]